MASRTAVASVKARPQPARCGEILDFAPHVTVALSTFYRAAWDTAWVTVQKCSSSNAGVSSPRANVRMCASRGADAAVWDVPQRARRRPANSRLAGCADVVCESRRICGRFQLLVQAAIARARDAQGSINFPRCARRTSTELKWRSPTRTEKNVDSPWCSTSTVPCTSTGADVDVAKSPSAYVYVTRVPVQMSRVPVQMWPHCAIRCCTILLCHNE